MNFRCRRHFFMFLFWYAFAWMSMSGQEPDFLPLNTAFPDSSDIIHTAKSQHQAQISKIKKEKEMTALYEQRFDRVIGDLRQGNYVNDAELNAVFAELTRRITKSNPELDQDQSRLFISRDPWPNAAYMRAYGAFDYAFTQESEDKTHFTVGFIDWDKESKARDKTSFGAITWIDGGYSLDKISMATDASNIFLQPGKPGYVMLYEYFRKEKRLEMRLEQVNF